MTVSLADGGMGLGTMWGEQTATKMLGDAGFTSIEVARVDGDIVNSYIIARRLLVLSDRGRVHFR
jgi:Zn-dependent membrane protease YugP